MTDELHHQICRLQEEKTCLIKALENLPRYRVELTTNRGLHITRDDTAHYISRIDMMKAIEEAQSGGPHG